MKQAVEALEAHKLSLISFAVLSGREEFVERVCDLVVGIFGDDPTEVCQECPILKSFDTQDGEKMLRGFGTVRSLFLGGGRAPRKKSMLFWPSFDSIRITSTIGVFTCCNTILPSLHTRPSSVRGH